MNLKELLQSVDLEKLKFSLLIISLKAPFLEWLQEYQNKQGLQDYVLNIPEEYPVWLIPPIVNFSEPDAFEMFLADVKPRLLRAQLHSFGATEADFPHSIDVETADRFLEVSLRTDAYLIGTLF